MAVDNKNLNPAVTEALGYVLTPMANPVNHGDFNRRMFIELVGIIGGTGIGMTKEEIISYACMSEKEFHIIKDEFISKHVIKEDVNMYDVTLYSLQLIPLS